MRLFSVLLVSLAALLLSACDFWPKDLKPLAESISQQVSGDTTAWLLGGDTIVIDVAGSPVYQATQPELEARAADIAELAIGFSGTPLEVIIITFYEGEFTEDPDDKREFIFRVESNRPVLQPFLDFDATGPLTVGEIQAAVDRLGESVTEEQRACVLGEVETRARAAGDPEALDPATIEFVSAEIWNDLDPFSKRLILTQAITTQALFLCASTRKAETNS